MKWGLALALVAAAWPARAQGIKLVGGACQSQSHTAEGSPAEDLTKKQTPFACDGAVVSFLDKANQHVMIQFGEKAAMAVSLLGFAGTMDERGEMLTVQRIYFQPGHAEDADGACRFFFKETVMTDIVCGGEVLADGHKKVAVVQFSVAPEAKPGVDGIDR